MLALILQWLRNSVKAAVLAGVQDAVMELDKGGTTDATDRVLESLKERFPAAIEAGDKKSKKAQAA